METFQPEGKSNRIKVIIPLAVAALLVITIIGVYIAKQGSNPVSNAADQSLQQSSSSNVADPVESGLYQSGTYSADGSYQSPGGGEQLGVTVTVENDIVTDVTVTPKAESPTGEAYQKRFIRAYKQFVVGKNIDEIQLDTVGGSSLTPKGFEEALDKIKADAKA